MKHYLRSIDSGHPVRNSPEQKAAFRAFVKEQAPGFEEKENDGHTNLFLGNAEDPRVLFCAHYDTPKRSVFPNLMLPANKALHLLYGLLIMLPLFAVIALFILLIGILPDSVNGLPTRPLLLVGYLIIYFGLFLLLFRGPANRHNANDNTSGAALVLELADKLGTGSGCAFLLTDDEEKGKLGSKAFAKACPAIKASVPVINLDCVGNGSTFVLSASDAFLSSSLCQRLRAAAEKKEIPLLILDRKHSKMNSDHLSFDCSAGVCACLKSRKGILYTPLIHTKKDTAADEENLRTLTVLFTDAVQDS